MSETECCVAFIYLIVCLVGTEYVFSLLKSIADLCLENSKGLSSIHKPVGFYGSCIARTMKLECHVS